MQWKFVQPLKQPCSGQSKTGSMQIFEVHELGPPSSELAPLSGNVSGGNSGGGAASSLPVPGEPSSPVVASSDEATLASSELALPPPLPLPPELPPPLPPELEQFVHGWPPPDVLPLGLTGPADDDSGGSPDEAQPVTPRAATRPTSHIACAETPIFRGSRITCAC
jgi:hypothetical protein